MICWQCHEAISDDDYCPHCGAFCGDSYADLIQQVDDHFEKIAKNRIPLANFRQVFTRLPWWAWADEFIHRYFRGAQKRSAILKRYCDWVDARYVAGVKDVFE